MQDGRDQRINVNRHALLIDGGILNFHAITSLVRVVYGLTSLNVSEPYLLKVEKLISKDLISDTESAASKNL